MLDIINLALPFFGLIFVGLACGKLLRLERDRPKGGQASPPFSFWPNMETSDELERRPKERRKSGL
jgi:hypothetical protein